MFYSHTSSLSGACFRTKPLLEKTNSRMYESSPNGPTHLNKKDFMASQKPPSDVVLPFAALATMYVLSNSLSIA